MSKLLEDFVRRNVEKLITSLTGYQVFIFFYTNCSLMVKTGFPKGRGSQFCIM